MMVTDGRKLERYNRKEGGGDSVNSIYVGDYFG
jgi:hypothetical protein